MKRIIFALCLLSLPALAQVAQGGFSQVGSCDGVTLGCDSMTYQDAAQPPRMVRYAQVNNPQVIVNGKGYPAETGSAAAVCQLLGLSLYKVTDTHKYSDQVLAVFRGAWTVNKYGSQRGINQIFCGPLTSDALPSNPSLAGAISVSNETHTVIARYYDIVNPRVPFLGSYYRPALQAAQGVCGTFSAPVVNVQSTEALASVDRNGQWAFDQQGVITGIRCGPQYINQ